VIVSVTLWNTGCRRRNVLKEDLVGQPLCFDLGLVSFFRPGFGVRVKLLARVSGRRGLPSGRGGSSSGEHWLGGVEPAFPLFSNVFFRETFNLQKHFVMGSKGVVYCPMSRPGELLFWALERKSRLKSEKSSFLLAGS
jgi:hypothetical protein